MGAIGVASCGPSLKWKRTTASSVSAKWAEAANRPKRNREIILGTLRGNELLMRTPMRRFGKPEELIGAAVLLSSEGASFLTSQCIAADGGYIASGVNS